MIGTLSNVLDQIVKVTEVSRLKLYLEDLVKLGILTLLIQLIQVTKMQHL
jgi:hypothetical protein